MRATSARWRCGRNGVGNRLGELLFLTAMVQAMDDGAWSVALEVRISNQIAMHLYSKYGFKAVLRNSVNITRMVRMLFLMKALLNDFSHRQYLRDNLFALQTALRRRLRSQKWCRARTRLNKSACLWASKGLLHNATDLRSHNFHGQIQTLISVA